MTQIAWAIFLAATIYADTMRVAKFGLYYESQSVLAVWIGIALAGLVASSVLGAIKR